MVLQITLWCASALVKQELTLAWPCTVFSPVPAECYSVEEAMITSFTQNTGGSSIATWTSHQPLTPLGSPSSHSQYSSHSFYSVPSTSADCPAFAYMCRPPLCYHGCSQVQWFGPYGLLCLQQLLFGQSFTFTLLVPFQVCTQVTCALLVHGWQSGMVHVIFLVPLLLLDMWDLVVCDLAP